MEGPPPCSAIPHSKPMLLRSAFVAVWLALVSPGFAQERIQVVTTTTDLRSLTEAVGGDRVVATMGRGAHLGEMALFADTGTPRTAWVHASTDVRAFRVAKWDLLPYVENHPDVAMAVIRELARRLEEANARAD